MCPRLLSTLLSLALLASPATAAPGQDPGTWRLETTQGSQTVHETTSRGFGALPLSTLVVVGAQVAYGADGATVRVGEREMRFRVGSAEVRSGAAALRLAHPVYEEDGVLYLPADFFRLHLAALGGPLLAVDGVARTIRRVGLPDHAVRAGRSGTVAAALTHAPAPSPVASRPAEPTGQEPAAAPAAPDEAPEASDDEPEGDSLAELVEGLEGDTTPGARARSARPRRAAQTGAGARSVRRLVVVDAGHGGRDPGARGPAGVREKDVTMGVARRLAEILRRDPTLEVRMTRDRDTLIALRDRTRLANRWKDEGQPALFLSIHANANPSAAARGFETYFLSEAKTADARRVEAMENAAQQYEDPHPDRMNTLDFIFHDLRQNQYLRESSDWAEIIQDKLGRVHPGPDRGVKQAGFFVLNGAFMPAVLVELGFITNRGEEQTLASPTRQQALAEQLAESVRAYFERTDAPPQRGSSGSRD